MVNSLIIGEFLEKYISEKLEMGGHFPSDEKIAMAATDYYIKVKGPLKGPNDLNEINRLVWLYMNEFRNRAIMNTIRLQRTIEEARANKEYAEKMWRGVREAEERKKNEPSFLNKLKKRFRGGKIAPVDHLIKNINEISKTTLKRKRKKRKGLK